MMGKLWFQTPNGKTVSVSTAKDYLEAIDKWKLLSGQEEATADIAEIPFDNHEGDTVAARSMEDYRNFLAKGWVPIKPSDVNYKMQILKML